MIPAGRSNSRPRFPVSIFRMPLACPVPDLPVTGAGRSAAPLFIFRRLTPALLHRAILPVKDVSTIELQPTLTGEHLSLRPLREDDFEALYTAASDPLIWEQHPQPTRWQREVFQTFFTLAMASGGAFTVVDPATGAILGSSRYYDWNPASREIAIGYTFLTRHYWGGPANREMKRLMLEHIFQWAEKVWFHIGTENRRSRKATEKLGGIYSHTADFPALGTPHAFYYIPVISLTS
ncbi:MAG: hypothetical protein JWO82_3424 [Akkermansiaceae bacterium]|nr:hypothetical protein [Akkermansiaceae bacterium]